MPILDMSEAFDYEILDTFEVRRREQNISQMGRATPVITPIVGVRGVVDSGDDNKIAIATDEVHQGKTLSIVTQFRLRGPSKVATDDYLPDLVLWNGDFFKVVLVEDYSRYGRGWIQAQCTSQDFVDQAPPEFVPVT